MDHVVHHVVARCLLGVVFHGETFGDAVVSVGDKGMFVAGELATNEVHEKSRAYDGPDDELEGQVGNLLTVSGRQGGG